MRGIKSFGALALVLLALSGCATVQKQAYNKETAAGIKSISIISDDKAEEYQAVMVAHPAASFGLIGGLIAATDMQTKSKKLTDSLDPKSTQLRERFAEKLTEALTKGGYEPAYLKVSEDVSDQAIATKLHSKVSSNAILLLNMHARYIAAGTGSDYLPYVVVEVKAIDNASGNMLYQDTISYGYTFANAKTVHLSSAAAYHFKDMDMLVADPAKTREGLYEGVDAIALQIAADLAK